MPGEELTQEEFEALARAKAERVLDARVVGALEHAPDLTAMIPHDFAARVAACVPAKKPAVRSFAAVRMTHYGRSAMWMALVALSIFIVIASRGDQRSAIVVVVETLLFVELAVIAGWLVLRRWREG